MTEIDTRIAPPTEDAAKSARLDHLIGQGLNEIQRREDIRSASDLKKTLGISAPLPEAMSPEEAIADFRKKATTVSSAAARSSISTKAEAPRGNNLFRRLKSFLKPGL